MPILLKPLIKYFWWLIMARTLNSCVFLERLYNLWFFVTWLFWGSDTNTYKGPSAAPGGEGTGTPLQYSCLENPIEGGAWWAAVHGVTKSQTRLSDFTFTFHFHALEKEMATHSSVLAWRIPGTEKPGRLQSMWSHRVRHDWSDLAAATLKILNFSKNQIVSNYKVLH